MREDAASVLPRLTLRSVTFAVRDGAVSCAP
jgi:hypothetical protein